MSSGLRAAIRGLLKVAMLLGIATAAEAKADAVPDCRSYDFPVAIADGKPQDYKIHAELCVPKGRKPTVVHVALHGGSYDHRYWDWPYKQETYSYVYALTAAGYAVLAVDRIGDGKSSRPPSAEVTFPSNAYTIHQVIQDLRNGAVTGTKFERIVLVGHSMGSSVAAIEADTYGDVDGIILTGSSHASLKSAKERDYAHKMQPFAMRANQDPKFAGMHLDDGYITSKPGMRADLFYNPARTEPKIFEIEEQIKDTYTQGELNTILDGLPTSKIQVPVLLVNGAQDQRACGPDYETYCASAASLMANEAPFFSPKACLQVLVMPQTKHALTATEAALLWYPYAIAWSNAFVGRDKPAVPCSP